MIRIARLLACLMVTLFAGHLRPAIAANDCHLKQFASIRLTVTDDGVYIPVTVENTPAMMTLNLKSAFSVMWLSAAKDRFNLDEEPLPAASHVYFGDRKVDSVVKIGFLRLGDVQINVERMLTIEPSQARAFWSPNELPMAGTIGMELFANLDFELDFKHNVLNLFSTDHCPGRVVYWSDTAASTPIQRGPLGNAYFPIELDGRKLAATLLIGTSTSELSTDVTRKLYGFDEHSADIDTERGPDGRSVSSYRAMALSAPGLKVLNAKIMLVPQINRGCALKTGFSRSSVVKYAQCTGGEAPLRLGMDVLTKLRLYFAMKENMMYFTAADEERASTGAAVLTPMH